MAAAYVDIEALLIAWIKSLGYKHASDELPTNLVDLCRTDPVFVVERFGGSDPVITRDVARVDIDTYANSRAGAKRHAERVRAAIRTQLLVYRHPGIAVGRVETISAPTHVAYDSKRAVRRFVATYQITAHATAGIS